MKEVSLSEAVDLLAKGRVIVYPTETFYGLGVAIDNQKSLASIFDLKGRDRTKPISILVSTKEQIKELVQDIDDNAIKIIDILLPGPLTLVLKSSPKISPFLHGGTGWIGIRHSSHPIARALVAGFGSPITTTSANPSGRPSATSEAMVREYFSEYEDIFFLSGGDLPPSRGSTVVKLDEGKLTLLREGDLPFCKIQSVMSDEPIKERQ